MASKPKITEITPAQAARFGEWSKKWIDIGLSTERADFERATAAALKAYDLCNLKRPMVILRMGSPYAATVGGTLASQVGSQVGSQVRSQVGSQVWSQVESQVGSQVWSQVNNHRSGALWASWGAYVSFLRDVLGWDGDTLPRFEIDEELIKTCGWVWWHENVLAISDRPTEIHRDDTGRLHSLTGPSIKYPDGWALYHSHGTSIPAEWIEDRPKLTPKMALTWENAEQRRAACEILGWEAILTELNAHVIDTDSDPEIGQLVEVDIPNTGRERFLRVRCGTGRGFALPVPPTVTTALEANAWTYDVPADLLKLKDFRT